MNVKTEKARIDAENAKTAEVEQRREADHQRDAARNAQLLAEKNAQETREALLYIRA